MTLNLKKNASIDIKNKDYITAFEKLKLLTTLDNHTHTHITYFWLSTQ